MRTATVSLLCAALLAAAGCATRTSTELEVSWASPQLPQEKIQKLLIISVAANEFVQIAFQDQMAAELNKRGVNAVASRRYFTRYTTAEEARFKQSIAASGADYVLLARVTNTTQNNREGGNLIIGANGQPYTDVTGVYSAYASYFNPMATYVPTADSTLKTVTAEVSLFAMKGDKLLWSARTRTANANFTVGEEVAKQYVPVILDAMKKDKLLR
jgi:hypothetical protein